MPDLNNLMNLAGAAPPLVLDHQGPTIIGLWHRQSCVYGAKCRVFTQRSVAGAGEAACW